MTRPRFLPARSLAGVLAAALVAAVLGVAPANAAEAPPFARDSFIRTTTTGLGTAELGGAWTHSPDGFRIDRGAVATLTPQAERIAYLGAVKSTDTDARITVAPPRPTTGSVEATLIGRRVNTDSYRTAVIIPAKGVPVVELRRNAVVLASVPLTSENFLPGERYQLRIQAVGTSPTVLRAKVWDAGRVEPSAWTATATDSTAALQAPGAVGFSAAQSQDATPASLELRFHSLNAASSVAPPPPPPANKAPRASFTMTQKGATVTFDASASTDSDGTIRSYQWDFGDGTKGTGKVVTHTYPGEGQWGIKLTITDDDGAFGRATNGVIVTSSPLFGKTIVSLNTFGGIRQEQYFGSGSDLRFGIAPTLTRGISFGVTSPATGTTIRIDVSPPSDQPLRVGHYPRVTDSNYDTPQIDITYGSIGESYFGDLDIRELTADSTGKITSFDIVFGGSDAQWASPLWGQIRANQPESSRYVLAARAFSFPSAPVGAKPIFATQWIRNTSSSALPVGRAAVTGGSTSDYVLADDRCSGKTLAAGSRCSLRVGYAPRAAGTRNATLSIPVDGVVQRIDLGGWAPAGTSKITVRSEDLGQPTGTTYANGSHRVWAQRVSTSTRFDAVPQGDEDYADVSIRHGQDDRLRLGWHPISTDPMDRNGHWMHIGVGSTGCQPWEGSSYTVHSLRQTADGVPTMVDLSFTAYCLGRSGTPTTGRVQYNLRSDLTAPSRPSSLTVSGSGSSRSVSWTKSSSGDLSHTVARLVPGSGTNGNGTSGYAVYSGTGTSAPLPAMKKGQRYTLHVFSVDKTGNVSAPSTLAVTG